MSLIHTVPCYVHALGAATGPGGSNWFDKFNTLATDATGSAKVAGSLIAVLLVVIVGWKTRGAIAGVVVGFISAALFAWMVNNVTSPALQKPISDTINGAGVVQQGPPPSAAGGVLRIGSS